MQELRLICSNSKGITKMHTNTDTNYRATSSFVFSPISRLKFYLPSFANWASFVQFPLLRLFYLSSLPPFVGLVRYLRYSLALSALTSYVLFRSLEGQLQLYTRQKRLLVLSFTSLPIFYTEFDPLNLSLPFI